MTDAHSKISPCCCPHCGHCTQTPVYYGGGYWPIPWYPPTLRPHHYYHPYSTYWTSLSGLTTTTTSSAASLDSRQFQNR